MAYWAHGGIKWFHSHGPVVVRDGRSLGSIADAFPFGGATALLRPSGRPSRKATGWPRAAGAASPPPTGSGVHGGSLGGGECQVYKHSIEPRSRTFFKISSHRHPGSREAAIRDLPTLARHADPGSRRARPGGRDGIKSGIIFLRIIIPLDLVCSSMIFSENRHAQALASARAMSAASAD